VRSLRGRLFAYLALAAALAAILTALAAGIVIHHRVAQQQITALSRVADIVAPLANANARVVVIGAGRAGPGPSGGAVERSHPAAAALRQAVLAAVASRGTPSGRIHVRGRDLVYVTREAQGGSLVLVRAAKLPQSDWSPYLLALVLAGIGGAAFAAALSFLLARRLTRPLRELAVATTRVAGGEADVTVPVRGDDELAQLGRAFNAMAAQLSDAHASQRAFLLSVSHELKTPLTAIRGYAEALEEGAVSGEEAAPVVAAEAARLERLVHDLLELAKLDRREFSIVRRPVALDVIARRALERFAPAARAAGVELRSAPPDDGPEAWVDADPDRLLQVVANLVENALRVTPAGGWVELVVAPGTLTVRDSGPGIAAADLPHAFERFYLHDRSPRERPVGSGLGLALVEQLTAAMGGTVHAASAPGEGAAFSVRLARSGAPASPVSGTAR
jgi:two-component system OmpR family sensor kinase